MTYPPQDPYGGQPPSSGFPQQGGYPPPEGYPQQGPYPPPLQGYPQQGGYPPPGGGYPYPGGYGPQPPKKSNTGLVVGVVAVVVVLLAALGITGFWQPGFFRSDAGSAESSQKQGGGTDPSAPAQPAPTEPTADAPAPPPGGSDDPAGNGAIAKRAMEDFLAKVNAGDRSGAESLMCPDSQKIGLDRAMEGKANLTLTDDPRDSSRITSSELAGTINGDPASGSIFAESADNGATWCVSGFFPR